MKKKQRISSKTTVVLLILFAVLVLAGIVLSTLTITSARSTLYEEHDKHLHDLSASVDHNVSTVLSRCRFQLGLLAEAGKDSEAELLAGSPEALQLFAAASANLTTDCSERVLAGTSGRILRSSREDDPCLYSLIGGVHDVWICKDETAEKNFLALSHTTGDGTEYYALVDLENFYRLVVSNTIYKDYWIVLYDEGSGLSLQNDYTQPEYKLFSREEILARNDGYSLMQVFQDSGIPGAASYSFTDKQGEKFSNRMYIIPSAASENGDFAVGIAIYDDSIETPTRQMVTHILTESFVTAFAAAALVFLLMHNRRREQEMETELASLEKQNELSNRLLAQQQALVHHQQLETIGTLTAGVAHEFNNLLSPIMGNSLLILEEAGTTEGPVYDNALEIYQASLRAKGLVTNIARLSRKNPASGMHPVSPAALMEDAVRMTAPSLSKKVTVIKEIADLPTFDGDETQLSHMLLNLILNASQAMPEGGQLTVSVSGTDEEVTFAVADTGSGIPEANLERIFDPFFTTKESGKGTGLGLAIAQRAAANHGGLIRAENLPECGARFTVTLPRHRAEGSDSEIISG